MIIDVVFFILFYAGIPSLTHAASRPWHKSSQDATEQNNTSVSWCVHLPGGSAKPKGSGWIFIHHILTGLSPTSQTTGHLEAEWMGYKLFANRDRVALVKNLNIQAINKLKKALNRKNEDEVNNALSVLKDGYIALLCQPDEETVFLKVIRPKVPTDDYPSLGLSLTTFKPSNDGIYKRTNRKDRLCPGLLVALSEGEIPDDLELLTDRSPEELATIIQEACRGAVLLSVVGEYNKPTGKKAACWKNGTHNRASPTYPEILRMHSYHGHNIDGHSLTSHFKLHFRGEKEGPKYALALSGLGQVKAGSQSRVGRRRLKYIMRVEGERPETGGRTECKKSVQDILEITIQDQHIHMQAPKGKLGTAAYYEGCDEGWCQKEIITDEVTFYQIHVGEVVVFATPKVLSSIQTIPRDIADIDILRTLASLDSGILCVARMSRIGDEEPNQVVS